MKLKQLLLNEVVQDPAVIGKKLAAVLLAKGWKKSFTVGDSGDLYAVSASELKDADDFSIFGLYDSDTNYPLVDFFFAFNGSWWSKDGTKITPAKMVSASRKIKGPDDEPPYWVELQPKNTVSKILA